MATGLEIGAAGLVGGDRVEAAAAGTHGLSYLTDLGLQVLPRWRISLRPTILQPLQRRADAASAHNGDRRAGGAPAQSAQCALTVGDAQQLGAHRAEKADCHAR